MDGWGKYGDFVLEADFLLCMIAWNLLCWDLVLQIKKWNRKRKEREQWRSSGQY